MQMTLGDGNLDGPGRVLTTPDAARPLDGGVHAAHSDRPPGRRWKGRLAANTLCSARSGFAVSSPAAIGSPVESAAHPTRRAGRGRRSHAGIPHGSH